MPRRRVPTVQPATFYHVTDAMVREFSRAKSGTRLHHLERAILVMMNENRQCIPTDGPLVIPAGIRPEWVLKRFVLHPAVEKFLAELHAWGAPPESTIERALRTYFDQGCRHRWEVGSADQPPSAA